MVVVRPGAVEDHEKVFFGATVTVEDEAGEKRRYRLVGPDEFDVERGMISIDSPFGRALLGREEGDEVTVQRPAGRAAYTIVGISYDS